MTPEGKVKKVVKQLLAKYTTWSYMPVSGGFGKDALDFIICFNGKFLSIETKAPGQWLTPLQRLCAAEIIEAGGTVYIVSRDDGLRSLERWLDRNR
jgi:hypothetical protein